MARYQYDIGILGGGSAGLTVAAGGARFGAKTILIEKSGKLGGDCLHYGCVPSKTLIRSAQIWADARRSAEFGLPEAVLPPVDIEKVMERVREVIASIQPHDSPERFCSLGVETRFGDASFNDPHTVSLNGEEISAKNWVIATGSRPAIPPVEGLEEVDFLTNETIFGIKKLPGKLLILGGGPIGIEFAQAFSSLGSEVTIVEFMDTIMPREDKPISDALAVLLRSGGVELLTATAAQTARREGEKVVLSIAPSKGGEPREISGDELLVATGRRPNIEGLSLEKAGVAYTRKGITINSRTRTSAKHIYACGDVTGEMNFTHVAGYHGSTALTNIVLHLPKKLDYSKVPWCIYTSPEVAGVGLSEREATEKGIKYRLLEEKFSQNDRALAEGEESGFVRIIASPKGHVLGARIVGANAGELIHEWVIAMNAKLKLSTIAGTVHTYPTLSEISKRVSGSFYEDALFGKRTRWLLRLLFKFQGRACYPPDKG
ncbi:MAG: mercuric reductase [Deltaproteobacteria bacterium]|nr:MAG: mercuric reductase [Deltaproteobacteria bacterium]